MPYKTYGVIQELIRQLRKHEAVIFVNNKEFAKLIMANIPGARVEVCKIPEKQEGYDIGYQYIKDELTPTDKKLEE